MNKTSTEQPLTIGIIGLGAIGCLISSQLPKNSKVLALPRNTHQDSIQFELTSPNGHSIGGRDTTQYYQWPIWKNEKLDVLLVCCKASQSLQALQQWNKAIHSDTQIVLLQNGFGQHSLFIEKFPNNPLFAASTTEGAFRSQPEAVTHAGIGQTQWGFYSGTHAAFKLPLASLQGNHSWSDNIKQVLLDKLAINAVINPLTVKYQCKNGELLTQPEAFAELIELCKETELFFEKIQLPLSFDLFEKAQFIAKLTANNVSSMLQDTKNKQPTEIDFINGYLLRKAIEHDIKLPISTSLVDLIKSYEAEKKIC